MLLVVVLSALAVVMATPSPGTDESPQITQKVIDVRYGGPTGILRLIDPRKDQQRGWVPDIDAQKRIIADVYSPVFLQPIWIIDHRQTPLKNRVPKTSIGGSVLIIPSVTHESNLRGDNEKNVWGRDEQDPNDSTRDRERDEKQDPYQNEEPQVIELNRLRNIALRKRQRGEERNTKRDRERDEQRIRGLTGQRDTDRDERNRERDEQRIRGLTGQRDTDRDERDRERDEQRRKGLTGQRDINRGLERDDRDRGHIEQRRKGLAGQRDIDRDLERDERDGERIEQRSKDRTDQRNIDREEEQDNRWGVKSKGPLENGDILGLRGNQGNIKKADKIKHSYDQAWARLPEIAFAGRLHK